MIQYMVSKEGKLVFVYNADSGTINALKDMIQKNISPDTYECNLCALTYGNLGMRRRWKTFIKELSIEVEFLHKDEVNTEEKLPAAFYKSDGREELFVSSEEINDCESLEELIELVDRRLKRWEI